MNFLFSRNFLDISRYMTTVTYGLNRNIVLFLNLKLLRNKHMLDTGSVLD